MVDLIDQQEVSYQSHTGGWEGVWGRAGEHFTKNSPGPPPKDFPSASLILLGTVHGDPQGYERALKLLRRWQPDLVTVEVSRFSLRYRQRQGARWRRLLDLALETLPPEARSHLAIQRLAAQVSLPFEVRAARDYARQSGTPWRPLDLGGLSRQNLPRYAKELLAPENLRTLLDSEDGSLEDYVAAEFRRARLAGERSLWRPGWPSPETRRRERFLARRLRRCLERYGRVVHLGGWEHLVPWQEGAGLWQELADLEPRRFFLDEADNEN
jgi:hypothetical protein